MKFYVKYFWLIALLASSCKQKAPTHHNFTMIEDTPGDEIKQYDLVSISYTEKTEDGKSLKGSGEYDERPEVLFVQKPDFKDDFLSMLCYLSKGDSAQFKVSIDSLKKINRRKFPADVKGRYLIYNIRVHDVLPKGNKQSEQYSNEIEDYRLKAYYTERDKEPAKLKAFINKNQLELQKAPLGFWYKIITPGQGTPAKVGDSVLVNYTGRTLTGKVFETTLASVAKQEGFYNPKYNYKPYGERLMAEPAKFAFTEALKMFPPKTSVMLVIPSNLAYGGEFYRVLPPYTAIVCNLEILNVISK